MTAFLDALGVVGLIVGVILWVAMYRSGMPGWRGAGPSKSPYAVDSPDKSEQGDRS